LGRHVFQSTKTGGLMQIVGFHVVDLRT
jgi:hypothetical protein